MFLTLLVVTFTVAVLVAFIVARLYQQSVHRISRPALARELSTSGQM